MGVPTLARDYWTEEEKVGFWLNERMLEACGGDEILTLELLAAGADYRKVARAYAAGCNSAVLAAIFA